MVENIQGLQSTFFFHFVLLCHSGRQSPVYWRTETLNLNPYVKGNPHCPEKPCGLTVLKRSALWRTTAWGRCLNRMAGVPPAGHVVVQEEPPCRALSISIRPSLLCGPRTGRLTATSTMSCRRLWFKKNNWKEYVANNCTELSLQRSTNTQNAAEDPLQSCTNLWLRGGKARSSSDKKLNHHWKYSHCCLKIILNLRQMPLWYLNHGFSTCELHCSIYQEDTIKNKGKILGIYSGFQSGRTGGSPAVWAELQKWDWRAFLQVELCLKGLKNTQ